MKRFFIVLFLSTVVFYNSQSQGNALSEQHTFIQKNAIATLNAFQNRLQSSIQKVYPASVRIITHEKLTPTGGVAASGVCVSEDGIIMTAGHLTVPGGDYTIFFPDGKEVKAKGLGKIGMLDLGLLKISEKGAFPFAELGRSLGLAIGEPCFSLAYPGSFPEKLVLRFGEVLGKDVGQFHSLQTSCLMEPGDSGGPVFDMNGKVIGIRSYIGMPLDENFEVAVDNYRKYWNELQNPVNYQGIPAIENKEVAAPDNEYKGLLWPEIEEKTRSVEMGVAKNTAEIRSGDSTGWQTVLGTIVDLRELTDDRKFLKGSFIVSKNSEVGIDPKLVLDEMIFDAEIIYRDSKRDLVLLQVDENTSAILRVHVSVSDSLGTGELGKILVSPFPGGGGEMSVIGTGTFILPGIYEAGYLGVKAETVNGFTAITHVQPNSAAASANLREGDVIESINGIKVNQPDDFINVLKGSKVRDVVSIAYQRNNKSDTLHIILQGRPFKGTGHIAEQFADGRSERRDGFDHVFIHDARLKPSECGGPLFDLRGNFVGVNMARYSRTSSIGMTAGEVVKFLKNAIDSDLKK